MGVINRIAVVPYPPLLIPELTVRAGAETEQLRSACLRAVSSLTDVTAEWVAVGADHSGPSVYGPDTAGTFAGFGVDVPVTFGSGRESAADPGLPLPALVAGWLRERAGAHQVTAHLLAVGATPEESRAFGARLERSSGADPVGLLLLGDGTNRRDDRSPFPPDERAAAVDELIRAALATADPARLLELDADLAVELGVRGRSALQSLAGVVESAGGAWRGELLYSGTPFGVTYHVAVWSRRDS